MIVTLKELRDLGACQNGLDEFRHAFGDGTELTRAVLLRMRRHANWVAWNHPLARPHRDAYVRGTRGHEEEWMAAMGPYWREHGRLGRIDEFHNEALSVTDRLHEAMASVLADLMGLARDGEAASVDNPAGTP